MNGAAYFVAGAERGRSLWKTDGTAAGTLQVRQFENLSQLINVNGVLYFSASDELDNLELWKSDGTEAGTSLVTEIRPGQSGSSLTSLLNVNGTLYFTANDGVAGPALWKSDGTAAGTRLVKDVIPNDSADRRFFLSAMGDMVVFVADGDLWRSDGTESGTFQLRSNVLNHQADVPMLTEANGVIYFRTVNAYEEQLWRTDGSIAGTYLVKDPSPTNFNVVRELINVNGTLYFAASDSNGIEFWKSDGTEAGTLLVKNIRSEGSSSPGLFTNVNGTIFFVAQGDATGMELWKSDGTEQGTTLVIDAYHGGNSSEQFNLTNVAGTLFFTGDSGYERGGQGELWKSDGTAAGTVPVRDIVPGPGSITGSSLFAFGDKLLFGADDLVHRHQPWVSDGSAAGTYMLADAWLATRDAGSSSPTNVNGIYYFSATGAGGIGHELWRTDGTAAGTRLAKDVNLGFYSSYPSSLLNVNGSLFFVADDGASGLELWRSDGSEAGTRLVRDIYPGRNAGAADRGLVAMIEVGGIVYFAGQDGAHGWELWRSDGTAGGTYMVGDLNPGAGSSNPSSLVNVDGALYFSATTPNEGYELWKVDPATGAPSLVADIRPGAEGSSPHRFVPAGDRLFFSANSGVAGQELWLKDAAGVRLVKDIAPGNASSSPNQIVSFGDSVVFVATTPEAGTELWRSDGTAVGTYLLRDIRPGASSGAVKYLVNVNGAIYFSAHDGVHGHELWRTDGTNSAALAHDLVPGPASSYPFGEIFRFPSGIIEQSLYFVAGQAEPGANRVIYRIGADSDSLQLLNDAFRFTNGVIGANFMADVNGDVCFVAPDLQFGSELRIIRRESLAKAGDYAADGVVDGADFLAWQRSYGSRIQTPGDGADGSGNGLITRSDLEIWREHFGEQAPVLAVAATSSLLFEAPTPAAVDAAFASVANEPFSPIGVAAIALRQATQVHNLDRPTYHVDRTTFVNVPSDNPGANPETALVKRLAPAAANASFASPASPPRQSLKSLIASELKTLADD